MKRHLEYMKYIARHKWYVFQECRKLGIPWRGLLHDLSKFDPREWGPYALSFYGPWKYRDRPDWLAFAFDRAWLRHIHRNPHHWQYWVLHFDDGATICLPMPDQYRKEMLADWIGAGKAQGNLDTKGWYLDQKRRGRIQLHSVTRIWIEKQLGVVSFFTFTVQAD